MQSKARHFFISVFVVGVGLAATILSARAAAPSIIITNLPAYGSQGNLSGLVLNANPATNCVAVFIYVAGGWYSKPSCAAPLTTIQPNGNWSADITTSSSDKNATEIAAFLVPTNYNQPCAEGETSLLIATQVEATAYANRVNPAARQFNFSGYGWSVKTGSGSQVGPGPNYFSDSTNNVWVDAQGLLHLKITYTNNTWQCAEIISDRSFGFGQYRFSVSAPVNNLDPNAVLGLFTYSDDAAYNDREIDMELSRWDYAFGSNDVEDYAIAPYGNGQTLRFPLPANTTNSTHSFIWQTNSVTFQTVRGDFASPPAVSNILESWNCPTGIPPAGGEQVHINLWLDNGSPPVNGQPVEVILSQFEFVPLGPPPPSDINQLTPLSNGNVRLNLLGAVDQHYQVFASSNLLAWFSIGNILATNNQFQFIDTSAVGINSRFYRVLTDP